MEEKILKAPVYTAQTFFKDSAEVPVDIDFNLPDYCPGISRILKCRAIARVSSKTVSDRNISVDGSVTVTVIYTDSENTINSYEYQYPFSKSFDTGTDSEGAFVFVKAKCEYINCRAVTERKIDIHGAVGIYVTASRRQSKDIICDIDDKNIEVLRANAPATMPVAAAEKYVIIDDEIDVGNSHPDIKCLIRYDAAATVSECKLLAGKAIIKGDLKVNLLYRGEQGQVQTLDTEIPFSQLLEVDSADENCDFEAGVSIAYLEIKPKFNSDEASRSFTLDGKLHISVQTFCNNDVEVITDAYSRKYEAQILSEDICINKLVLNVNDTFTAKSEIEFAGGTVSGIGDMWAEIKGENTKIEDGCLTVSGMATVGIIAFDENGVPAFFEKPVDFSYSYKLPVSSDDLKAEPKISILSVNYTMSGGNDIEVRLEMALTAAVYECRKLPLVSDVVIDEDKPTSLAGRSSMTVYFAEPGESLWDIARKYLASVDEVRRLNAVEGDVLTKRQMILIPST